MSGGFNVRPTGAKGARRPDPIKAMIAQAVQHHMVTGSDRPPLPQKDPDVESIETHILGPLETQLRVKTYTQGTRYFNIRVSESI
jgi:hypothetical protein